MRGKLIKKLEQGGVMQAINRWRRDKRGIAAVEFAFVVPVLLVSYLGAIEIGQAIEVNKKVGRSASMIADLLTQESDVDVSQIRAIMDIGTLILEPYTRFDLAIEVTAIEVTDEDTPKIKVVWSQKLDDGNYSVPYAKGSLVTTLPANLQTRGSFIIRVTSALQYQPIVTWVLADRGGKIDMDETYFLRPRVTARIECTNCP